MLKIALLATLVALTNSGRVNYTDCGNNELKWVDVTGCDTTKQCVLYKGDEVTITADFVANQDAQTTKIKIDATVGGISATLSETDGCELTKCPIVNGIEQQIGKTVTIPPKAPSVTADVICQLIAGDSGKALFCGKLSNVKITNRA